MEPKQPKADYEQAQIIPAADLLAYLDQVIVALAGQLRAMTPAQLHTLVPGITGRRTPYRWVRPICQGCFGYLGEIAALKSLQPRPR